MFGTLGAKATAEQLVCPLPRERHSLFRAVAARADHLAADGPAAQFATKEACRWMAQPTELVMGGLKRLSRYLGGRRRLVL